MGKQIKRSLIMLLCIAMIAATCGIAAFAEDTAAVAELIPTGETTGKTYTSIDDAFLDASYGGYTVKLLADVKPQYGFAFELNDGDLIIDLNNHNIATTGAPAFTVEAGNLEITGKGTIEGDGEILRVKGNYNYYTASSKETPSNLTVGKDVTVISNNDNCLFMFGGNGAEAHIYGSLESKGKYAAIQGTGALNEKDGDRGRTKTYIHEGASVKAKTVAIYHPQSGVINVDGTLYSSASSGIEMRSGTLNVSDTAVITSAASAYAYEYNGNGGTTDGAAIAVAPYKSSAKKDSAITVNVNGGKFIAPKALSYENPGTTVDEPVNINVTGGTFSTDITEALTNTDVTSNINDISVIKNDDGTYSVGTPVAQVGEVKYTSLEAAFAAAETGATVTLLADAAVKNTAAVDGGKAITLDLNNHNITSDAETAFKVSNGELTVTGTGKIVTEGEVFRLAGNNKYDTWNTPTIAKLTVGENVTAVSNGDVGIYYYGNGAEAHVYGNVTSHYYYAAIQGNGTLSEKDNRNDGGTKLYIYPGAVVMADSSLSSPYTATGIYHPQSGEVYITGGTITSEGSTAIEIRNGSLNVEGNPAITSNAKEFAFSANSSGATTDGAAVAVVPYSNRDIDVNIKGGTFKGLKALYYATPKNVKGFTVDFNVTGGTYSTDITEALTNADVKSNIAEITVVKNDDGTFGVKTRDEKFEKVAFIQHNENKKKLTFFAGINYLDYEKAGFRVNVNGVSKDIPAYTVYTEYIDSVGTKTAADNFKANYFFAANLDVEDTSIKEFTITPFAALLNGTEVLGEPTTVTVTVGGAE